eukprot:jgi/Botrbrau1/20978/Bobra.0538s0001.1
MHRSSTNQVPWIPEPPAARLPRLRIPYTRHVARGGIRRILLTFKSVVTSEEEEGEGDIGLALLSHFCNKNELHLSSP